MVYTERRDNAQLTELRNTIKALKTSGIDCCVLAKKYNCSHTFLKGVLQGRTKSRRLLAKLERFAAKQTLNENQKIVKKLFDLQLCHQDIADHLNIKNRSRISEAIHCCSDNYKCFRKNSKQLLGIRQYLCSLGSDDVLISL